MRWARRQVLITTSKRAPCLQIGSFPSWKCYFYLSCVFQSFCGCQSKWCREISPPHLIGISCCGAVAIPPTLYLWSSILRWPGSSKGWQPVLGSIGPLCSTNTALIIKKKKKEYLEIIEFGFLIIFLIILLELCRSRRVLSAEGENTLRNLHNWMNKQSRITAVSKVDYLDLPEFAMKKWRLNSLVSLNHTFIWWYERAFKWIYGLGI